MNPTVTVDHGSATLYSGRSLRWCLEARDTLETRWGTIRDPCIFFNTGVYTPLFWVSLTGESYTSDTVVFRAPAPPSDSWCPSSFSP